MLGTIVVLLGLVVFEIVNSIDNAIVNAHVLRTVSARARRWFLIWGILTAVVVIRGVLPFLIVWLSASELSFVEALRATFGGDAEIGHIIEEKKFIILMGGGIFLALLYLHWLFLEKKEPFFIPDKLIKPHYGIWFFGFTAVLLVVLLYLSRASPLMMLSAAIGNAVFFILYGFKEQAEKKEHELHGAHLSDISKLMYLEILDTTFSFDGVLGAFAFTTNVMLILIGNGIGALVVRDLTIRGIDRVARYKWLKNGAMTSIGFLGVFMMVEAFGIELPEWIPTVITLALVGVAFFASHRLLKKEGVVHLHV
ncbi:hypothetical protein A3D72_00810 [Candidatus Uhrbacteria bacterium RIFCSPHIGHO2_02_FULL_57_19]|uniref:DUF475 domain-containing protein n=1 Tax=Candidatus Uhrbacteria bacterium RIFCSPHIGHO2_02_FULL_57_19 TaxID=1802391 RepID=A0A1F7U9F8_9BACT|nr:MAG: hypothetical protein A3D72_00810 [Candidatus Uhrbacteria bacterium RIFCSPHIGHO2_02_FULL_57_19]